MASTAKIPTVYVDAFTPQLSTDRVELVGQLGDQMRRKSSNIDWFADFSASSAEPLGRAKALGRLIRVMFKNGLWPLRMAPSFGASMLPPETMQIISPLPAWPVMAAATDAAPAASAMIDAAGQETNRLRNSLRRKRHAAYPRSREQRHISSSTVVLPIHRRTLMWAPRRPAVCQSAAAGERPRIRDIIRT